MNITINDIKVQMEQDIKCDIYGHIYGHERWAEDYHDLLVRCIKLQEEIEFLRHGDRYYNS